MNVQMHTAEASTNPTPVPNSITVRVEEAGLDVEVRIEHYERSSRELINAAALAADTAIHASTRPVSEITYHHVDDNRADPTDPDTVEQPIVAGA